MREDHKALKADDWPSSADAAIGCIVLEWGRRTPHSSSPATSRAIFKLDRQRRRSLDHRTIGVRQVDVAAVHELPGDPGPRDGIDGRRLPDPDRRERATLTFNSRTATAPPKLFLDPS